MSWRLHGRARMVSPDHQAAGTEFARRFPYSDGGKPVPTFSADKDYELNSGEPVMIGLYELEGQGLRWWTRCRSGCVRVIRMLRRRASVFRH